MDTGTTGRAEDTARYAAAHRWLDSPARMLAIVRAVARLDMAGPPAAARLTARMPLRGAVRIGLFAGSFNPLTFAHLALADAARRQAKLDLVAWAVAAVTVDKERVERAALPDRLAQLAAFARRSGRAKDAVVLLNRGLYVDQARILAALAGPRARVFIVVGFDKVVQIFDPRYYADRDAALRDLFAAADLLVAPRADAGADELRALLGRPENRPFAPRVTPLRVPPGHRFDSSTEVRRLAASQGDAEGRTAELAKLLPPEALTLVATGAYAPPDPAGQDAYALRQAWLSILPALPRDALLRLPPLGALVALALADSALAAELRRAREAPDTLLRLLHSPPG